MDAVRPLTGDNELVVDEVSSWARHVQTAAEARAKLIMTIAMWSVSHVLLTLGNILSGTPDVAARSGVRALIEVFGLALCFMLHLLLRSLAHRSFRTRAIVLGIAGSIAGEIYAWVSYFGISFYRGLTPHFTIVDWNEAVSALSLWTWFFMAWTGLYLAIEYAFDAREESRRASELRTLAHNAKLQALSNQISPHFLFNSLNSISALILDNRSVEAERMLTGLATFFRSSLAIDPLLDISLEQELDLHRRYLAIEQMRYPDLAIDIDLPDLLREATVPALILQPLIENAIKHGIAQTPPPAFIRVVVEQASGNLIIRIVNSRRSGTDNCTDRPSGIGLANVRNRLTEYFGDRQAMSVRAVDDSFEAMIALPLRLSS